MAVKQRYRVTEKVDAGGMAEIFKGFAVSLDGIQKLVAIKRVRPHLASNKKFIKMFIDEARLSMRLSHANITQVFDVGRAQGTYFLVMDFVDGGNLRKIMQVAAEKGYKIPISITVSVIIEVCKALAHAHAVKDENGLPLSIVHRDVSPPNIMISHQGEVKITDFGLAKAVSHLDTTDPGVVKGKFSYLSPEACEGHSVDARADIFSLGVVLHELLTGRRLFMGKNDLETVELVRKCDVPPPSIFNPEVGPELDEIVLRTLSRDRKARYQSARDLGDSLAGYLFEKNLKVTTFDIAQMMRFLFEEGEGSSYPKRVMEIIHEEIINLSSIGKLPGVNPTEGGKPLDVESFRQRRTPFEDIWKDFEGVDFDGDPLVDTKLDSSTSGVGTSGTPQTVPQKPAEAKPSRKDKKKAREGTRQKKAEEKKKKKRGEEIAASYTPNVQKKQSSAWVAWVILLLAAGAGGAAFFFVYEYFIK